MLQHTARMLGRLYQAIECQGLRAGGRSPRCIGLRGGRELPIYSMALAAEERTIRLIVQAVLGHRSAERKHRSKEPPEPFGSS